MATANFRAAVKKKRETRVNEKNCISQIQAFKRHLLFYCIYLGFTLSISSSLPLFRFTSSLLGKINPFIYSGGNQQLKEGRGERWNLSPGDRSLAPCTQAARISKGTNTAQKPCCAAFSL